MFNKQLNKSWLIKFSASLLATALAFTSIPITSYADGTPVQGANSGGGSGGMTSSSSSLAWSSNNQGYRMYIINENFERVSPVYDFRFVTPSQVGKVLTSTRFDSAISPVDTYYGSIEDLAVWTNSDSDEIPKPVSNNQGHGDKFKKWLLGGDSGWADDGNLGLITQPTTPGTQGGSSSSTTPKPGNTSEPGSTTEPTNPSTGEQIESGIPTRIKLQIDMGKAVMISAPSENPYDTELGIRAVNDAIATYMSYYNIIVDNTLNDYYNYGITLDDAIYRAAGYLYSSMPRTVYPRVFFGTDSISYIEREFELSDEAVCFILKRLKENAELKYKGLHTSTLPNTTNLLNQNIPLSNTIDNVEKVEGETVSTIDAPIIKLLKKTNGIQVAGYTSAAAALSDELHPHYLVVEPITWLNVRINSGAWDSPSTYNSYKTYGSYWNIANEWGSFGGGFYNSYMTSLGNNCLQSNSTYIGTNGKILNGYQNNDKKSITESIAIMNQPAGLSMHMYCAMNIDETHTWDSITHPKDPGPAPDPTLLNDDETNKTVVIIKNYVTLDTTDPANPVEKVDGNYIRTLNPHQITIEDEPGPGYKVIAWKTSTEPTPPSFTPTTPYEELTRNSNSIQEGTTPTVVVTSK